MKRRLIVPTEIIIREHKSNLTQPRLFYMATFLLFGLGVSSCRRIERCWVYLRKRLWPSRQQKLSKVK